MWLIRIFKKKLRPVLNVFWILIISCLTFLLMVVAILQFRDECFQAHIPPNEDHIRRCGIVLLQTERDILRPILSINSEKEAIAPKLDFLRQHSVGNNEGKERAAREILAVRKQVLEYFESRRNLTKQSCLEMFRKEDESQSLTNELSSEVLPKAQISNEGKFFMRATNPTRWIFYKHNSSQLEMQWCPLYKSGSSSWMAVFAKLQGALSDITERKIQKGTITFMHLATDFRMFHSAAFTRLTRDNKIQVYTMVVVRHPFKRILSAYRDKLERIKGREYYSKTFGKTIIQKFRREKEMKVDILGRSYKIMASPLGVISRIDLQNVRTAKLGINRGRSFSNKNGFGDNNPLNNVNRVPHNLKVPTFEEFCKYLVTVDPTTMNEHWRPQFLDCSPCHHNFDLILKVEDIEKDKLQVLKLLGFVNKTSREYQEVESIWNRWTNRNTVTHRFNESFYFSQLSNSLMQQLYDLYEADFRLFDYIPDEYFGMTK